MALQTNLDGTDRRDNKGLVECMIHMLTEEVMCDVTFRVGRDKTPIKAHKYMLASRSPVFYTMFEGSLPETGEINVPDIDENIFQIILRYIYSDELTLSNGNVKDILYAADKYMLRQVKTPCFELLKETACSSNAVVALQTACQFGLMELHETSLAYIENNTGKCLSSEYIMQLPKECMEIILRSELLSCSETDILKCLLQWAKVRCTEANQEVKGDNLRNIIGNLLPLVKFPLVEKQYFATVISDTDLLTQPEIVSVFRSHYGFHNIFFSKKIREPLQKRTTSTLTRHGSTASPWTSRGIEALKITPDRDIWLKGIVMFGPTVIMLSKFGPASFIPSSKQNFTFAILDEEENVISALKGSISVLNGEKRSTIIPRPVYLTANKSYTLVVKDLDVNTYYGTNCKASLTANGVTVIFETSPLCTTETDKDKGQIAGIVFCN